MKTKNQTINQLKSNCGGSYQNIVKIDTKNNFILSSSEVDGTYSVFASFHKILDTKLNQYYLDKIELTVINYKSSGTLYGIDSAKIINGSKQIQIEIKMIVGGLKYFLLNNISSPQNRHIVKNDKCLYVNKILLPKFYKYRIQKKSFDKLPLKEQPFYEIYHSQDTKDVNYFETKEVYEQRKKDGIIYYVPYQNEEYFDANFFERDGLVVKSKQNIYKNPELAPGQRCKDALHTMIL